MGSFAIVVNGAPGAGKTTLALALGDELRLPVVAKDAVKEALADAVAARLPTSQLGAIASDAMWRLVGLVDGPVIVESFWFTGRDEAFFEAGLRAGRITRGVELWCEAPLETVRERFLTRPRHPAHDDAGRITEWERFAREARPISGFPVVRVDTGTAVEVKALAGILRPMLEA